MSNRIGTFVPMAEHKFYRDGRSRVVAFIEGDSIKTAVANFRSSPSPGYWRSALYGKGGRKELTPQPTHVECDVTDEEWGPLPWFSGYERFVDDEDCSDVTAQP